MTDEAPPLEWVEGAPRSRRFGDVYFSAVDGLAESRAVFLAGCGLPQAWAGRRRFVVGELGFGTGLNILALLALWRDARPAGARLHLFSVEAFPLTRHEAAQALAAWPELGDLAARLLAAWPDGRPGFHRIDFPALGAILDLYLGDVVEALAAWDGRADAWFLDGFAPARNPQMWAQAVLDLVAARSAPSARAATFTVAGAVRRGLAQAGFAVEKRPGFGRKRERLEAALPGAPVAEPAAPRVAIIGAGIAGASLAYALAALGIAAEVVDAAGPGSGASGNPAALVAPRLDAGGGAIAALHAEACARALELYRAVAGAALAAGALQLESGPRDAARFDRIAAWDGFAPGAVARASAESVTAAVGEPAAAGLSLRDVATIAPKAVLDAWLPPVLVAEVAALQPAPSGWRLLDAAGAVILEADVVCVAAGPHSACLAPLGPLRPVRGQVSTAAGAPPGGAVAWGGYVIPTAEGLLFGATHDRDDWDTAVREGDHARNLALLAHARPQLAESLEGAALGGRASLRAATPDHMPLAGAIPGRPGLFVLTGLGGRGFTLAPVLAEHVAAQAVGAPGPLPRALSALVDPARYSPLLAGERRSGSDASQRSSSFGREAIRGDPSEA